MRKPQWAAKRGNSGFSRSLPPPGRSSSTTTALIWSNRQLARHAAERGEGVLQAAHHDLHRLALVERDREQPRVAEHDQEGEALAPGEAHVGEVDLRLVPRRRLEADDRLRLGTRPHVATYAFTWL